MSGAPPVRVGYYVHHHGSGHLHRAGALARELAGRDVVPTGLSSLARPAQWPGEWVALPRDDAPEPGLDDPATRGPDARGRLHWAPRGHTGLRARHARIAAWLDAARPDVVVVDVSVEVALLVRLHGVPVVGVVLPGVRDDAAHRLGHDVADALVGLWPADATGILLDVDPAVERRVRAVGGLSRFPVEAGDPVDRRPGPPRVLVLGGSGGDAWSEGDLERAVAAAPTWDWQVLGGTRGAWVADPRAAVRAADVVLTHAGQNALAEVAALRRPAVVVPAPRPHDEQARTGAALVAGPWPAVVLDALRGPGWPGALERARTLDGAAWAGWCDGRAAARFADIVLATAREPVP
ncbi:undecaprenyldiphospho-muramoylpentapeptide beta-N- acetylglucosaminyltransferase [Nocardioides dokdonensis FR1436]|uniref:Undecaprenyldiphospho-muramoylpentapeptide beta-N-acetylglucosaminyltransferase n=1 Tax=Nocardioides dokdonensis FR1436 TaxID=1300347 RepID=A0A1A9GIJ9_9ACTN|nr:glycosyltransferase [Nocardioides dokdonensis]ANH38064.1 undecaprenyldiphospho-muramoylpentapeptide beta-N- acetylglucosaminyltransferase [Nocardioides dokdonensis FR1436]